MRIIIAIFTAYINHILTMDEVFHKTYEVVCDRSTIFVNRKDIDNELLLNFPCEYRIGVSYDFPYTGKEWIFRKITDDDGEDIIDAAGGVVGMYQCEICIRTGDFDVSIQYIKDRGYVPLQ